MKKEVGLIIFPSQIGVIGKHTDNPHFEYLPILRMNSGWSFVEKSWASNHLYVTDNSEIDFKKDWVFHIDAVGGEHIISPNSWEPNVKFCKKIIATTDPSLRIKCEGCQGKGVGEDGRCCTKGCGGYQVKMLPKLSQSFIEDWCKNPENNFMAEFSGGCCGRCDGVDDECVPTPIEISLTSNGEVILYPIKEKLYTLEEVKQLISEFNMYVASCVNSECDWSKSEWIKENL